jgi:Ca2+-binding EF-hand superfamily protein
MALYGVGLNVAVRKINMDLRLYISKTKGSFSIRSLKQIFKQLDRNGNGKLDPEEFEKGLNQIGFFLKKVDFQTLIKYYDTDKDG